MKIKNSISVYEHQSLRYDRGEQRITLKELNALQRFYGEKGVPYFNLIHHGVKFNEYVGVIQIGETTIEVLPKMDKNIEVSSKEDWRIVLIEMLNSVGIFDIHSPSISSLKLRPHSILDLYFELFVSEVENLIRRGLIRKYRKKEGNKYALKGSLHFSRHIQNNLVHQERFYVKYSTYDKIHTIHQILLKTIKLLCQINTNSFLNSRIGELSLNFPEMPDVKVNEFLFQKIILDRKSECYANSLQIAKLILLNFHPDISKGKNDVLALMFDMNLLWEEFVFTSLRKFKPFGTTIKAQNVKQFWKPSNGRGVKLKPDIVINKDKPDCVILDTKWKDLNGYNPSTNDLRQMYVYGKLYSANKVALLYPNFEFQMREGKYYNEDGELGNNQCCIITIPVYKNIREWQKEISKQVFGWTR